MYRCASTVLWSNGVRVPVMRLFLRDGALWFMIITCSSRYPSLLNIVSEHLSTQAR